MKCLQRLFEFVILPFPFSQSLTAMALSGLFVLFCLTVPKITIAKYKRPAKNIQSAAFEKITRQSIAALYAANADLKACSESTPKYLSAHKIGSAPINPKENISVKAKSPLHCLSFAPNGAFIRKDEICRSNFFGYLRYF